MFRSKLATIFDRILTISVFLTGVLVVFLMLSVSMEVALRYFFGRPTTWVTEISSYALLYIPFLAAAWILKEDGHVRMDFLLNKLNRKSQYFMNMLTSFVGATICFLLTCFGAKITIYFYEKGYRMASALRMPRYAVVAIIVFGSFLLFIQFLRMGCGYLEKLRALQNESQEQQRNASPN